MLPSHRTIVGVTGASGSIYAERAVIRLLLSKQRTYVVFTETAKKVIETEAPNGLLSSLCRSKARRRFEENSEIRTAANELGLGAEHLAELRVFENDDLYAPIASGSEGATHMLVCPASMGSCARIAHGISSNLLERAADVMLKERRTLVIVPRETPLSLIHLQNMVTLTQAGAQIVPAMPAFYHMPKTIEEIVDFVVERSLAALGLPLLAEQNQIRWNFRQL